MKKITIALTPDQLEMVKQAVNKGDYVSNSEVIRDALRLWKYHQSARQQELEELQKLWQEGIQSGPGQFQSMDEIKREARRRAAPSRSSE